MTRALPVTLEAVQTVRTDTLLAAFTRVSRLAQTGSAHVIAMGAVHTATRLAATNAICANRALILTPANTHTLHSQ